jgi:hypothetical protein
MFEDRLEAALGCRADLTVLAGDTHDDDKTTGCRKLLVAAAWADAHSAPDRPDTDRSDQTDTCEDMAAARMITLGPAGCPPVLEGAPGGLAIAYQTSVGGAKAILGDALNLRHRLPRLWRRVQAGEVHAWKAREVAHRTAHLSPLHAAQVDRLVTEHLETLAWRRFEKVLDATLLHVDEATYQQRAAQARSHRDVWATHSEDGLRTLIARCDAGDITVFLGLIDRLADLLADDGDDDPIGARRAKAIGIAAYPERVLDILLRHAGDPDTHSEPWQTADTDPGDTGDDPWHPGAPPAGWQTPEHSNYHQPDPNEPAEDASQPSEEPDQAEPHEPDAAEAAETPAAEAAEAGDTAEPEADEEAIEPEPEVVGGLTAGLAAFATLDPATRNRLLERARPTVVIHLHLSDDALASGRGVARTALGPITLDQLRGWLLDTCPNIKVYPVFHPGDVPAVDAYEIPLNVRRAVGYREPGSVFPYSPATHRTDLDHTQPYRHGGPPGQTGPGTLGPNARGEHRTKTHGGWHARQPDPGLYLWRTPQGWIAITTNQGTLTLRDSPFTQQIWRAATTPDLQQAS